MTDVDRERREEAVDQTRRDLERLEKRPSQEGFWKALRVLGSIGWPIAILTLLGVVAGRLVDGPRWLTAGLIAAGAALGFSVALSGVGRRTR
ncbi:MAG: hypothetical protein H6737_27765 [Alphaproteobacteria bacterium]|nr:hypothetical protein [Alphaproteobacteria bacterium]